MKMTQKRSLIGAAIIATGASDYFTQDMEHDENPSQTKKSLGEAPQMKKQPQKSVAAAKKNIVAVTHMKAPVCCEKEMIVSKYPDRDTGVNPYFCTTCRTKQPGPIAIAKGAR